MSVTMLLRYYWGYRPFTKMVFFIEILSLKILFLIAMVTPSSLILVFQRKLKTSTNSTNPSAVHQPIFHYKS
jgi:hypothetical protein